MVDITRVGKRTSGLLEYAEQWNGEKNTNCRWEELIRLNSRVNGVDSMIEKMRMEANIEVSEVKGEDVVDRVVPMAGETDSKSREVGGTLGDEVGEVEQVRGRKTKRMISDGADQVRDGRVRTTMFLGTGARRREHLRIINGCRTVVELKDKIALLRIWRVELTYGHGEDKVEGDGYCGYSAMAQIINGHMRKYNLRDRCDRLEVGMAMRNIINKASGHIREGFEKLRASELNAKERSEMAYKELMVERTHFLSHRGLPAEYWMRGMMVDGRCDELKFSSWVKSVWDERLFMLQECQYSKRGENLTVGEWRRVLAEKMLMCRDNHYYTREGGMMGSFEHAIDVLTGRMAERLRLEEGGGSIGTEVISLIDHTPVGYMDSLLVAEALVSGRSPPSLLSINKAGTSGKLREIRKLVKGEGDGGEGNELIIGEGIGYEEMRMLCKDQKNGMVVIRNGVMERVCVKTNKPDVILDEDLDHFYLNGVGSEVRESGVEVNRVAFWNCNGWRGELHVGKERTFGEMAANEDVEMICVLDTRLDGFLGLHVVGQTCEALKIHTGKSWVGREFSRKEDARAGGCMILHTVNWTAVKMVEKIRYGSCVEVSGKWLGISHKIVAVYRPCNNDSEGSLRATLDYEMKGKLEEVLWGTVTEKGNETIKIVGGDFNMDGIRMDQQINEAGGAVERVRVAADQYTFRRMDSVNGAILTSTIDHIATSGGMSRGCKISEGGMDMTDTTVFLLGG